MLRSYFGDEKDEGRCGICENCRRGLAEQADRPVQAFEQKPFPKKVADTEPELSVGDAVTLPKYGEGKVKALDGDDALVVGFPDGRSRKFRREFARPVNRSAQKR